MLTRIALAAALALPASSLGTPPWEKVPEKWDRADAYRILQDSPWSPAQVKFDAKGASRPTDPQTGLPAVSTVNPNYTNTVPGVEVARGKQLPLVPVLWWSSKTVRLARQRLRQLHDPKSMQALDAPSLSDYVLAIEGSEPQRIFSDASEDLRDTVFLELLGGAVLDLQTVQFVDATDDQDARTEFHFVREVDGQPAIDPDIDRVIFHCRATAKNVRAFRDNAISLRAEFKPRTMRVRGVPDL
jgi:hypothetical protein